MRQRPTSASTPMRSLIRVATVAAVAAVVASEIAAAAKAVSQKLSTHKPTTALSTIKAKSTTRNSRRAFVCGQSIITPNTSPVHTIHRWLRKEHHHHSRSIWLGSVIGRYGGSFQTYGGDRVYSCRISSSWGNSHSSRRLSSGVPVLSVNSPDLHDNHDRRRPRPMLLAMKSVSGEFGSDYGAKEENYLAGPRQERQQQQQHQPPPKQGQQQHESKRGRGGRRPFSHITDETLDHIRSSTSITEVIGR